MNALTAVLTQPTPDNLWQLRSQLLESALPADNPAWDILDKFFTFLNDLQGHMSTREYTELASKLDVGAVGAVAMQGLLEAHPDSDSFWQQLGLGIISESLIIAASRQYIKGAQAEIEALFRGAAWHAYQAWWHFSATMRPEMDNKERRQLLDNLFNTIHHPDVSDEAKALLLGRLFQILLLAQLGIDD